VAPFHWGLAASSRISKKGAPFLAFFAGSGAFDFHAAKFNDWCVEVGFRSYSLRGEVDVREIPTSPKEREKWGTRHPDLFPQDSFFGNRWSRNVHPSQIELLRAN